MVNDAVIGFVLRNALSDPGRVVQRKGLHDSAMEPLLHWQARAVQAALAARGWTIIAKSDLERLNATASPPG